MNRYYYTINEGEEALSALEVFNHIQCKPHPKGDIKPKPNEKCFYTMEMFNGNPLYCIHAYAPEVENIVNSLTDKDGNPISELYKFPIKQENAFSLV